MLVAALMLAINNVVRGSSAKNGHLQFIRKFEFDIIEER